MKKVLLTGCSKGMGFAICKKLLKDGYFVYGISRTKPKIVDKNFVHIKADLLTENVWKKLDVVKDIDILINNAGIGYFDSLENISDKEIHSLLYLNLSMPILLTRRFLPMIKKHKGYVINIGSESALQGRKLGTVYCASKFGLRGFSEALFDEVRKEGVKVCQINPGITKTSFFDDKKFSYVNEQSSYIDPSDIANIISDVLVMREGSVIKEINLFPQVNKVKR